MVAHVSRPTTSLLPPELWLQIFRLAASSDPSLYLVKYTPFESHSDPSPSLKVKHAIVLVCRQWHALGTEILFESVNVDHGLSALKHTLEDDAEGEIRKRVRRAVVPYTSSRTPTYHPPPALSILRQCPRLEVLVRPVSPGSNPWEDSQYQYPVDVPSFPLLKRLDWWHDNEAACTGGINSLDDVLCQAPKLEYLSFGGQMSMGALRLQHRVHLPELKVLRLQRVNAIAIRQLCMWQMPTLAHVVIEQPPANLECLQGLWDSIGAQVKSVELGVDRQFFSQDYIPTVVACCPEITELNYRVCLTSSPDFPKLECHPALQRVGIHGLALQCGGDLDVEAKLWDHIERHLTAYSKDGFPSLSEYVLYGEEWRPFVEHQRFQHAREVAAGLGRALTLDVETPYSA
ncbi:hypothetical protein OF83DRAFT_1170554 [Amylostereum chailletii]|nr:hypothetical protein OF83DRAFT_1170554 [Amylostereum chailletii]